MAEIKVGLIASPEFPTNLANDLKEELPERFQKAFSQDDTWTVETLTDGLISTAEDENQLLDGVLNRQQEKSWDYTICLTDIPIFYKKEVVLARIHPNENIAVLSLPALGWFVNRRVMNTVLKVMADLYYEESKEAKGQVNEEFSISTIQTIRADEGNTSAIRYYFSSRMIGIFTILSGMTYDNQPWKIMASLKTVIAIAFGSGAYGMIFPTLWGIGYHYSPMRLTVYMLLAVIGLVLWIIQGHNLWETKTVTGDSTYKRLYNTATISTLLIAVSLFYIILFLLFLVTAFVFVDPHYFVEQVGTSHLPSFLDYTQIAWITTSVGTVTGAIGVGLEDKESVRQATYGYRQRERYKEMEKRQEEEEAVEESTKPE